MSTLAQLVDRTRQRLNGAVGRDRINRNAATMNPGNTVVYLSYPPDPNVAPGTVVEINYERMLVTAVSGSQLTVVRGFDGTPIGDAHAIGDIVRFEPRFAADSILDSLLDELRSLPDELHRSAGLQVTFPADTNVVDLLANSGLAPDTPPVRILDAMRIDENGIARTVQARLLRAVPASYLSGYAIALSNGARYAETVQVSFQIGYRLATAVSEPSTDLQATVGLPLTAEDILPMGAGARLLSDKDALRGDIARQGQSRQAEEVPMDLLSRQAGRWRETADRRISEEITKLLNQYPYREV